jgi:hypothetical protein
MEKSSGKEAWGWGRRETKARTGDTAGLILPSWDRNHFTFISDLSSASLTQATVPLIKYFPRP